MKYKVGDLVQIKTSPALKEFRGAVGLISEIFGSVEYGDCYHVLIQGENKSIIFNPYEFQSV